LSATVAVPANAEPFRITTIQVSTEGLIAVGFPADTSAYYVLYRGAALDTLDHPVSLVLETAAVAQLADPDAAGGIRFYRVRQVPVNESLDLDGDGMHDLFELRHRLILNPLDPLDGVQKPDSDARNNKEERRRPLCRGDHVQPDLARQQQHYGLARYGRLFDRQRCVRIDHPRQGSAALGPMVSALFSVHGTLASARMAPTCKDLL